MDGKRQVEVEVVVQAPLERVWEYAMDISKIPEFHPRVDNVVLLSGSSLGGRRESPTSARSCTDVAGVAASSRSPSWYR